MGLHNPECLCGFALDSGPFHSFGPESLFGLGSCSSFLPDPKLGLISGVLLGLYSGPGFRDLLGLGLKSALSFGDRFAEILGALCRLTARGRLGLGSFFSSGLLLRERSGLLLDSRPNFALGLQLLLQLGTCLCPIPGKRFGFCPGFGFGLQFLLCLCQRRGIRLDLFSCLCLGG